MPAPEGPRPGELTILIEGWRWILHSYAVVTQYHLLELCKRPGLRLYFRDLPYLGAKWRPLRGLFRPDEEAVIEAVPPLPDGLVPDVALRLSVPYDLRPAAARATVTFATADMGMLPSAMIVGGQPLGDAQRASGNWMLTPSRWSRGGLLRSGADPDTVLVVPHGIDTHRFRPVDAARRAALRERLGWAGRFVFLHTGAMTGNKGVDLICQTFARVARDHPEALLYFKGSDHTYRSTQLFEEAMSGLDAEDRATIRSAMVYEGSAFDFDAMAELFQAADAYLSPYASEGFNMPVLEAVACGLPVICSAGGPTDDFVRDDFARRVRTRLAGSQDGSIFLLVDPGDLEAAMREALRPGAWAEKARFAGPAWAHRQFSWARVTDLLVEALCRAAGRPVPPIPASP